MNMKELIQTAWKRRIKQFNQTYRAAGEGIK